MFKSIAKVKKGKGDETSPEVDCIIDDNEFILEVEKPVLIPLLQIKKWYASIGTPSPEETDFRPASVTYIDEVGKKQTLSFLLSVYDTSTFNMELQKAIDKAKNRWFELLPPENNWFANHLNWTVVLSWVAALFLSVVGIFIWGSTLQILGLLIILITTSWSLWKKNRSLFYLLLYLIPIPFLGPILILSLAREPKLGTLNYEVKNDGAR